METKFTPIAMRCTQEQFEAIKPKLPEESLKDITSFKICGYLTNNWGGKKMDISNISDFAKKYYGRTVYETWNEATFLRCCGIEVEETFTVSKKFILEAHNSACLTWKRKLEKQFPSVFVKEVLEDKTYYIFDNGAIQYNEKNGFGYGICAFKTWVDNAEWLNNEQNGKFRKATPEEVETALINEAKKRGFEKGVYVNCLKRTENVNIPNKACFVFNFNYNHIYFGGAKIFHNGKWATIIEQPTEMTVAEIEAKLGCKIKIVG